MLKNCDSLKLDAFLAALTTIPDLKQICMENSSFFTKEAYTGLIQKYIVVWISGKSITTNKNEHLDLFDKSILAINFALLAYTMKEVLKSPKLSPDEEKELNKALALLQEKEIDVKSINDQITDSLKNILSDESKLTKRQLEEREEYLKDLFDDYFKDQKFLPILNSSLKLNFDQPYCCFVNNKLLITYLSILSDSYKAKITSLSISKLNTCVNDLLFTGFLSLPVQFLTELKLNFFDFNSKKTCNNITGLRHLEILDLSNSSLTLSYLINILPELHKMSYLYLENCNFKPSELFIEPIINAMKDNFIFLSLTFNEQYIDLLEKETNRKRNKIENQIKESREKIMTNQLMNITQTVCILNENGITTLYCSNGIARLVRKLEYIFNTKKIDCFDFSTNKHLIISDEDKRKLLKEIEKYITLKNQQFTLKLPFFEVMMGGEEKEIHIKKNHGLSGKNFDFDKELKLIEKVFGNSFKITVDE